MGVGYLLDTNAAIEYLNNTLPAQAGDIIDAHPIQLSVISRLELLSWPQLTDPQIQVIQSFISSATVWGLDEKIILQAIELRRSGIKIKLPDAIIAATALVNGLILISRNIADFKNVPGLNSFNPYEN